LQKRAVWPLWSIFSNGGHNRTVLLYKYRYMHTFIVCYSCLLAGYRFYWFHFTIWAVKKQNVRNQWWDSFSVRHVQPLKHFGHLTSLAVLQKKIMYKTIRHCRIYTLTIHTCTWLEYNIYLHSLGNLILYCFMSYSYINQYWIIVCKINVLLVKISIVVLMSGLLIYCFNPVPVVKCFSGKFRYRSAVHERNKKI